MAVRTSLTWIKRRFSRAIRRLAERELWSLDRFEFTGTFDESSGRFSLVFGTDYPAGDPAFVEYYPLHAKIKDALREEFLDYPSLMMNIGLVIQQVETGQLEQIFQQLMIGEDDVDLGDLKTLSS